MQEKLMQLINTFSTNENIQIQYLDSYGESFGLYVDIGTYAFYLEHKLNHSIRIDIVHKTKDRNEQEAIHSIFPKTDDLKPLICDRLRFAKGAYIFNSTIDCLYKDIEGVVSNIKKNFSTLNLLLDNSTLRFPDGTMKVRRKSWKSPARIKGIYQESNRDVIQRIKKSDQPTYDNMPGLFGSNGTYVGYEERYYLLKVIIIRPGQEVFETVVDKINIENFIRDYYLPKLQRQRMSPNLRDEMNQILAKQNIEVITKSFDDDGAVSADATYLPVGFNSWNDYLKSIF